MPRLKNIKTSYEGTYGAHLDAPSTAPSAAHVLMEANQKTLNWARVHWPQFSEDEIDWTPGHLLVTVYAETRRENLRAELQAIAAEGGIDARLASRRLS